jgi:hypothetical protein
LTPNQNWNLSCFLLKIIFLIPEINYIVSFFWILSNILNKHIYIYDLKEFNCSFQYLRLAKIRNSIFKSHIKKIMIYEFIMIYEVFMYMYICMCMCVGSWCHHNRDTVDVLENCLLYSQVWGRLPIW